jgi:hypothetical protein
MDRLCKIINLSLLVSFLVLILIAPVLASQANELKSPATRIEPNYTYRLFFQNPGAPDQLLLDEPDSPGGGQVRNLEIQHHVVFFTEAQSRLQGGYQSRDTRLSVNVNSLPFDFYNDNPPSLQSECVVDFNDEGALTLTEPSLWFDRVYVPWFQSCGGGDFVDIRAPVVGHFHVGFQNPDVVQCPTHPQAYPSLLQDDGTCDFVDVPTEPRTYLTTHSPAEYIRIRFYSNNQYVKFALNQMRVQGGNSVRVCYRKDQELDLSWLTSGESSGTVSGIWLCWSELSPGAWDFSNWVWDVTDVKVTGAQGTIGPFSLDDLKIGVQ